MYWRPRGWRDKIVGRKWASSGPRVKDASAKETDVQGSRIKKANCRGPRSGLHGRGLSVVLLWGSRGQPQFAGLSGERERERECGIFKGSFVGLGRRRKRNATVRRNKHARADQKKGGGGLGDPPPPSLPSSSRMRRKLGQTTS